VVAAGVVLTGADFVSIVLTSYAIRTAILVPVVLALFWPRMTGAGFVAGTIAGIALGMPVRSAYGELLGSLTILTVSSLVPLLLGLLNRQRYDFARLKGVNDAAVAADKQPYAAAHASRGVESFPV
jgi:Na+/proline symporter